MEGIHMLTYVYVIWENIAETNRFITNWVSSTNPGTWIEKGEIKCKYALNNF